jgi:hypothetical protein
MESIKVKLVGLGALLIHDNKGANPLSKEAKAMKEQSGKRNKTDSDYAALARMDWEAGLYLHDGVVALPARCIEKTFLNGARKSKNGKQFESGVFLEDDYCPLDYKGLKIKTSNRNGTFPDPELDKFFEAHSWAEMVRVGQQQVLRTRPIFYDWSCICTVLFDNSVLNQRTLLSCMEDAGRLVGLCEKRPRLGRFMVEVV